MDTSLPLSFGFFVLPMSRFKSLSFRSLFSTMWSRFRRGAFTDWRVPASQADICLCAVTTFYRIRREGLKWSLGICGMPRDFQGWYVRWGMVFIKSSCSSWLIQASTLIFARPKNTLGGKAGGYGEPYHCGVSHRSNTSTASSNPQPPRTANISHSQHLAQPTWHPPQTPRPRPHSAAS
jgi:hypothetical protein